MNIDKKGLAVLAFAIPGVLATMLAVVVLMSAFRAFVAVNLYTWFAVPLNAPELNFWHMWGLLLLFNIVTYKPAKIGGKKDAWQRLANGFLAEIIGYSMLLLVGWLIKGNI